MTLAEGYILLTEVVEKEGDQFVAHCLELDTATCGDTIEEAFSNLRDAIVVHLNALEEVGTIERVFNERNIIVHPVASPVEQWPWPIPVSEAVNKIVRPVKQHIPVPA